MTSEGGREVTLAAARKTRPPAQQRALWDRPVTTQAPVLPSRPGMPAPPRTCEACGMPYTPRAYCAPAGPPAAPGLAGHACVTGLSIR